jgi:hypothetical protein
MTGSKDTVIWLPTTYTVCQTPFICMKWIWYEYAGDGRSQSYPTECAQWEIHSKSYNPAHPFGAMVWYGVVANMTTSHGWRLYNTFYRYEVNLVWVCRGWEVPIISYSMFPVRTPLRILRLAHSLLEWWYGMVLHPKGHPPHIKHDKHFLYIWSGSCMSMEGMGDINHTLQHIPSEKPTQNPTTQPNPFGVMV